MENPSDPQRKQDDSQGRPGRSFNWLFPALFIFLIILLLVSIFTNTPRSEISYKDFLNFVEGKDQNGEIVRDDNDHPYDSLIQYVDFGPYSATGMFKVRVNKQPKFNRRTGDLEKPPKDAKLEELFSVNFGGPDSPERENAIKAVEKTGSIRYDIDSPSNASAYYYAMFLALTFGILMFMMVSMRRSQNQMMGGGGFLSSFSRSPAKRYEVSDKPVTFKDVAGLEGVKADLGEIVEFLKDPSRFEKLGGRVPKGALLIGPPGTGKTLLARAIAGEAGVPYFSVNGSEFIQMFVGVGASRVRDLFATAKAQSPAIIFVDEIDAVGRQRGAGVGGGHDEREQTLNQILGEMDGFQVNDAVIVVAATNRPDSLDPALLRPGRFDHDKVLMGAKREEILSDEEKEKTAYHEAGHTLTAWRLKGASPVHKVTVIPRGRALGVTLETIDAEVHSILTAAAKRALDLLVEHKKDLEAITRGLMEHEELDRKQITELIGDSVHATRQKAIQQAEAKKEAEAVEPTASATDGGDTTTSS